MKCEICHKGDATTAYTHIVDDEKKTLLLCTACLPSEMKVTSEFVVNSDLTKSSSLDSHSHDPQIPKLKKKAKVDFSSAPIMGGVNEESCSKCGMAYKQFKKVGRLGCSNCYTTFQSYLGPLIKKIHGADKHCGKSWNDVKQSGMPFTEMSLKELNLQLQKAVDREAFEKAAEIRDLIRLRSEEVEKGEGNDSR